MLIDSSVKALIFDCDGTLVDSMPLHMDAWREAFKFLNAVYEEEFLYSLKGMKELEIIELYNKSFSTSLDPAEIVNVKQNYFFEHINNVTPIEPVVDMVKRHYEKLPLAVVSGSIKKIVYKELQVIGIFDFFDVILTADDPYTPKPSPDVFLAAAEKLKVDPHACLVFEDGDPGLEAARLAGMKTIDIRLHIEEKI